MSEKHPDCSCQCDIGFKIPGLERSLCPSFGWVKTPPPEKPKQNSKPPARRHRIVSIYLGGDALRIAATLQQSFNSS